MNDQVIQLIKPQDKDLGGLQVRRLLPAGARRMVGPFIFFDHVGPADFVAGRGVDVRPHPHIGLATVTYLFEGSLVHRDGLGSVREIRPGDVNCMTAGKGIVHSERSAPAARAAASRLHGLQTWVALPRAAEEAEPDFHHHAVATLPAWTEQGVAMRLVVGSAFGQRSPVGTFSATCYIAVEARAGSRIALPREHEELAIYVVSGEARVGDTRVPAHHMAVLPQGGVGEIRAEAASRVMIVGGERADGDRYIWWNFVSSSRERIEQAKEDWRAGRFAAVPGETDHIPLPER